MRQILLLGYWSGFQVWDVNDSNNVRDLVSRQDGPVSFMQMVPTPIVSKRPEDKYAGKHPLLVICMDGGVNDRGGISVGVGDNGGDSDGVSDSDNEKCHS